MTLVFAALTLVFGVLWMMTLAAYFDERMLRYQLLSDLNEGETF